MKKKKPVRKIDFKRISKKFYDGFKWVLGKLWSAKDYILAIFVGMFALFSKGYFAGYKRRSDEQDDKVDERIDLLTKLSGESSEGIDDIEEARDLIDEYGIDNLRTAACKLEEEWPESEET